MNDNIATEEPVIPALERVEQWPADVWLARHYDKEWLSASRAAGALGYDDFSSPLKNHHELRGDIERPDTTLPMELGHMLEPTVDELYKRMSREGILKLINYPLKHNEAFVTKLISYFRP